MVKVVVRCWLFIVAIFILNIWECNSTDSECIDKLILWIRENGGDISPSIEIRSRDDIKNRGVYVVDRLYSNDIIASIPISLLFTLENASKLLKTILPQNKKDVFSNLGGIDTLSLALIIEYQNDDSFWNIYLKCLPSIKEIKDDLKMPLYWTENEIIKYLQHSKVGFFILRRLNSIHESFNEINAILQSISYMKDIINFTLDHWIWALSIVWSRSFSVMIDNKKIKCLVPFGDLFNFNDNLNDNIDISPMNWNQSQYAQDLMKYDVKSYTSKDGEMFIFKIKDNKNGNNKLIYSSGMELYAEYSMEVLPNFVVFLDYGFCIKNNPMDGIWITIEDILNSLNFVKKFKNKKIKTKSQEMMKELIEKLQLNQIFVLRSMMSEYYMDIAQITMEKQKRFIEPYGYSLFLMSLILNSKNDILLFGDDLLNFKQNYKNIKTNQDVIAVIIHILKQKYKSNKKAKKLIKNTWNAINNYIKSEMTNYQTSLIQDLMLREELIANNKTNIDIKLDCGLNIRIDDKFVLFTVWIQLQRLRELLLSLIEPS